MVVGHNSDEYTTFCYSPPFAGIFGEWDCGTAPDVWNQAWIFGMYYLDKTATYSQIYAAVMTANSGTKMNQLKAGLFYSDIKSYDGGVAQLGVQMGTDAWFANGNKQVLEALMSAPGRAAGTVYHYVFGGLTDPKMYLMGACHGCELTYVLGFYQRQMTFLSSQTPASLGDQTVVPSGGSNLVGNAMNSYWSSLWWYGTPNTAGSGLPQWVPMAGNDKQTMTFSIDYATGALMNPCVRFTTCRTEPTKDWRYAQKQFWGSSPTDIPVAMPACTSAPAAQVTLPEAKTGIACNFLPCCTYTTTGRRMLFGMPSSSSPSNCDAMC